VCGDKQFKSNKLSRIRPTKNLKTSLKSLCGVKLFYCLPTTLVLRNTPVDTYLASVLFIKFEVVVQVKFQCFHIVMVVR